jgi:MFS family permease
MLKNRGFLRLWSAYSVSTLGDEVYVLAVPFLVYQEGGTASTMALVQSCALLPQAVFGFFGGVFADRSDKMRLLRIAYLASSVTLLVTLFGYVAVEDTRLVLLTAAAMILSAFAAISAASVDSAIPHFAPPKQLARANSMTETTRTVATVLGPAAAGVLVTAAFPGLAILVNCAAFAVSFVLLKGLFAPPEAKPAGQHPANGVLRDLAEGVRYLARSRPLFIGIFLSTSANLIFGAYEAMLIYYFRADLGLSEEWTGAALSAAGAASVLTAFLLAWRAPSKDFGRIMAAAILLQGIGVLVIPLGGGVTSAVCGQVVLTVFLVVYTVYWRAFRQSVCAPRLLGRVSGACRAIAFTGTFLGSLVSTMVLRVVSDVAAVLLGIGALTVVIGVAGFFLLAWSAQSGGESPGRGGPGYGDQHEQSDDGEPHAQHQPPASGVVGETQHGQQPGSGGGGQPA